jgi:transposase InsO family protein
MKSITATKTINIMRQVFARNGVPSQIVSDNGPTFISEKFREFMSSNGIKHTQSAPYHPATNGLVERFIQTFKQSMKAMKQETLIANFLLTYRQTPHSSTHETPSKLFLGRELRSRLHLLKPNIKNTVRSNQEKACEMRQEKKYRQFEVGERVIARDYRGKDPWVAGNISEREGPLMYKVATDKGQIWRRHTEQLKATKMEQTREAPNVDDYCCT